MSDAPRYRLWPPIDVGVPLVLGLTLTATLGDPVSLPHWLVPFGWLLVGAFALWNGWALVLMAKNRTAVLPGGPTRTVLDRGPFRVSRNPLYLGLLALHAGIALLWPSFWALVAVPVSAGLLLWGAIVPEEQYLKVKFVRSRIRAVRRAGPALVVTPGSRKPEGQVVRRFLTRGSPMQRMTPIEPSGDDHSPTYP